MTSATLVGPRSVLAIVVLLLAACSPVGGTLGGRQRCWSETTETRIPSLMRGTLELDRAGSVLATPEGERLTLLFAGPRLESDTSGLKLVAGGQTVAVNGEPVTLFGGLGADESMVVCGIEERHTGRAAARA